MTDQTHLCLKDMPVRERVLVATYGAIIREGISAVSMDSIAQHLHVSKRTIYILFHTKKDLVRESVNHALGALCDERDVIRRTKDSCLEKLIAISRLYIRELHRAQPPFWHEIERSFEYQEVFADFRCYWKHVFMEILEACCRQGAIERKYISDREDLKKFLQIFLRVLYNIHVTHAPDSLDTLRQTAFILLRGISSPESIRWMDEHLGKSL